MYRLPTFFCCFTEARYNATSFARMSRFFRVNLPVYPFYSYPVLICHVSPVKSQGDSYTASSL